VNDIPQRWEYKIETSLPGQDRVPQVEARLNALGGEGWELMRFEAIRPLLPTEPAYVQYVFKRAR
jgi:hypothetical protein